MTAAPQSRDPIASWNAYWYGESSEARGPVLQRLLYLMLSFDCWIELAAHGARYGEGNFNVAHFAWLDAVLPVPTPGVYVGLVVFSGLLAFALAIGGPTRLGAGLLAGAYTFAWMMSLLDSYQHHYLLSLYLFLFVWFSEGWARHLLAVTTGIVYDFTGIMKTEAAWRSGVALQRISLGPMKPFLALAEKLGIGPGVFWPLVGHSVIALQLVIATGYLLAPLADRGPRWLRAVCLVAWFSAISFHIGAEILDLRVGWFSYYMMLVASALLLPRSWIEAMVRLGGRLGAQARALAVEAVAPGMGPVFGQAIAAGFVAVVLAYLVDMPGAIVAAIAFGVFLAWDVVLAKSDRLPAAWLRVAAGIAAAAALWLSMASSETRYDFYRFAGGDARKRGELESALSAYLKADKYAPPGQSRRQQIDEVRAMLGK